MKVCVFTQQFGTRWSGVGTYATNLVAGLIRKGVDVTVVCPTGMRGEDMGARVLEVALKGWESKVNYWLPLAWRFGIVLKTILQKERFDVAHFTDAREALFAPKDVAPLVGAVNDYYPATCPLNPFELKPHYAEWKSRWVYWRAVRLMEPTAYRKLSGVAANSEYIKKVLVDAYRLNPSHIDVVNYGIDGGRPENPIKLEGAPSVLFVGANFQRKGLPQLLRAIAKVKETLPGVVLSIVGDDPRRAAMESLAAELRLGDSARFLGGRPNDEVRRMKPDMFVMPSLIEGFGIVFLEAMLAGVPVIGGKTGGTVELIEDGANGFTVEPTDVEELATKITRLATDAGLREKFVSAGSKTASHYTVERMVDGTMNLFDKVISNKKAV